MGIFDKLKKVLRNKKSYELIFKLSRYRLKEYTSVNKFPNILSNFVSSKSVGSNFYITLYKCPCCKSNPLYKTAFPLGKEYKITTALGFVYMEEVFTCPTCYSVFTPLQNESFDCGEIFSIKLNNEKEYFEYLLPLNIFGLLKDNM